MINHFRDNGGKLPTGLGIIINRTGRTINVSPYPGFFSRGGYIRTCIVWKRKDYDFLDRIGHLFVKPHPWKWSCRKCFYSGAMPTWKLAYQAAHSHAHNHH